MSEAVAAPSVMTPLGDRVVVQIIDETLEQRASGLFVPEGRRVNNAAPHRARVIDVGPKVPSDVRPGGEVLLEAFVDGVELKMNGATFRVVGAKAIIAIITDKRPREAFAQNYARLKVEWNEAYPTEPGPWEVDWGEW